MNQIDLKGRVAVITGGARGIGFACAQRFIDSGARVALWDLDGMRSRPPLPALEQPRGALSLTSPTKARNQRGAAIDARSVRPD